MKLTLNDHATMPVKDLLVSVNSANGAEIRLLGTGITLDMNMFDLMTLTEELNQACKLLKRKANIIE